MKKFDKKLSKSSVKNLYSITKDIIESVLAILGLAKAAIVITIATCFSLMLLFVILFIYLVIQLVG